MAGIREMIAEGLGLDISGPHVKDDVNTLIEGYSRNNDGQVTPGIVIGDVRTAAENIVDNLPRASAGYDFKHEVLDCGKDRQETAIDIFSKGAAAECLPNRYWENIDNWAHAIYSVAGNMFEERAFGNGIEGYRDFEKGMPRHNIHAVAEALGKEDETVKFLAENGTAKDFRDYMIDVRNNPDHPDDIEEGVWTSYTVQNDPLDNGHNGAAVHGCTRDLSGRIFTEVANAVENGTFTHFDRDGIMREMTAIYRADGMTNDEKIDVQNACAKSGCTDRDYPQDVSAICRSDVDNKADVLTRYFESNDGIYKNDLTRLCRSDIENKAEAVHDFISIPVDMEGSSNLTGIISNALHPGEEADLKEKFDAMMDEVQEKYDAGILTVDGFAEICAEYGFGRDRFNESNISIPQEGGNVMLRGEYNPVTDDYAYYETDGRGLSNVIESVNEKEHADTRDAIESAFALKEGTSVSYFGSDDPWEMDHSAFAVTVHGENGDNAVAFGINPEHLNEYDISCDMKHIDSDLHVVKERPSETVARGNDFGDIRRDMRSIAKENGAFHTFDISYRPYFTPGGEAEYYADGKLIAKEEADADWKYDSLMTRYDFMLQFAEHEDGIGAISEKTESDGPYSDMHVLLNDIALFEGRLPDPAYLDSETEEKIDEAMEKISSDLDRDGIGRYADASSGNEYLLEKTDGDGGTFSYAIIAPSSDENGGYEAFRTGSKEEALEYMKAVAVMPDIRETVANERKRAAFDDKEEDSVSKENKDDADRQEYGEDEDIDDDDRNEWND